MTVTRAQNEKEKKEKNTLLLVYCTWYCAFVSVVLIFGIHLTAVAVSQYAAVRYGTAVAIYTRIRYSFFSRVIGKTTVEWVEGIDSIDHSKKI